MNQQSNQETHCLKGLKTPDSLKEDEMTVLPLSRVQVCPAERREVQAGGCSSLWRRHTIVGRVWREDVPFLSFSYEGGFYKVLPDKKYSKFYSYHSLPFKGNIDTSCGAQQEHVSFYRDSHKQGTEIYKDFSLVVIQKNITSCGLYNIRTQQQKEKKRERRLHLNFVEVQRNIFRWDTFLQEEVW